MKKYVKNEKFKTRQSPYVQNMDAIFYEFTNLNNKFQMAFMGVCMWSSIERIVYLWRSINFYNSFGFC